MATIDLARLKELAEQLDATAVGLVGLTRSHPHIVSIDLVALMRDSAEASLDLLARLEKVEAWAEPDEPLSLIFDGYLRGHATAKSEVLRLLREEGR